MREVIGFFSILPLITWLLFSKKNSDIANPYNLFTFLYIINIMIPIILYINIDSDQFITKVYIKEAVEENLIYIKYVILQTISYYLVVLGIKLKIRSFTSNFKDYRINNLLEYRYIGIILWIIGVLAFFKIMNQVGGIKYFFTHLQFRTILMRDIDFLSWLLPFMEYGILFIVYSYRGKEKVINNKLIFVLIFFTGIMSGLGGRKALIMLLIEVFLLYHYCIKQVNIKKILKLKYVFIIFLIYIFFTLMVKFRIEGAFVEFLENPLSFIKNSNEGILETIKNESYVEFYMVIIKYFRTNEFWRGRTFLGLVTAIIPSSIFPNKPPVDDGTYLYSICNGRTDIVPPMAFNKLDISSFPLETFGSMYSNFGIVGLFLGMIILGMVYKYFYRKMKEKSYNLFNTIIYIQVIFTFQLSTLRIFQLFSIIIPLYILTFCIDKILKKEYFCILKNK
ncbi:O-antigen polymerase [Fusobacterium sp.]|uniref:O-antigen polymerase n=1 Tax=Fusobacterium sp. TaxID=68766 RepID=UPI00263A3508|nr:O-antigen polymerase [Fusobacterium sp.]